MDNTFQLAAYDYQLPEHQIAQHPVTERDKSRLMVLNCPDNKKTHHQFDQITQWLRPGDLLVVNNSKVFPARLIGHKETGGRVEMLLLHFPEEIADSNHPQARALTLIKSSKRPKTGTILTFGDRLTARVEAIREDGKVEVTLGYAAGEHLETLINALGKIPLPPYIRRPKGNSTEDQRRYQTTYASATGSVAAPTAGLHFSNSLIRSIQDMGVTIAQVTLHVGYGTFAPVRCEDIRQHQIHEEYVSVSEDTARKINQARKDGNRIWAVGTTSARTLEFAADDNGRVSAVNAFCTLYIYPGYRFKVVENLITNFHLPQSSLLFLVAALAGKTPILDSYNEAVKQGYRFFSYGDAMAIITRP